MQAVLAFFRTLGGARLGAMVAVTAALIGFFAFIIMQVTTPQMTVLFSDLTTEDASAIIKELDRQAIAYELKRDGSTVLVPKDRVTRLRMALAEGGLPRGGGVGYEIFDKSDVLGTTSFVQNINHLRALEGELSRTIRALDRVQSARVHLVLPERPLFARNAPEPSAAIVLRVRGVLDANQVRAIRHLVASAVSGLKAEKVSVVDEAGRLLANGADDDTANGAAAEERKTGTERRLQSQIEAIVSSVVGPGKARAQVSAEMDYNRVTQTSDRFDPEGRVVRSSQTREEQSQSNEGKEGQVSVGNELPGAARGQQENQGGGTREQNKKTEEIVNYEISRTTKTETIEAGRIIRLSAAVLVDGSYTKNDKGELTYQARSKEELDRIGALVRTAIGFDAKRGDQVEIVNLPFVEPAAVPPQEPAGWMSMFQFTKDDIMRGIELAVMAFLSLIVLLMVVRPMVRRILTSDHPPAVPQGGAPALIPGQPASAIAEANARTEDMQVASGATAKMIDVAQVQGQVHAQSVQRVGELADKNPSEAASVVRQWLNEPA